MVSVVIPTYNRAQLLTEAIQSVLAQSFTAYEIIVVDDGSTDDTETRVRAYGVGVDYVRTQNGGVAHARNVGMRRARGRYLIFLDSDDKLYPYALELQVQLLNRYPETAFVCAEMSGFDDHGFFDRYHLKTYHRSAYRNPAVTYERMFSSSMPLEKAINVPPSLLEVDSAVGARAVYVGNVFDTYLLNLVLCQNSVMVRREVAEDVGSRNTAVRHWQEVDYLLRITRRRIICFVDVPTYQLRYHPGQVSGTAGPDGTYRWMRKQQILLRVVKRHALADADYYQAHRQQIERHLAHLHRAVAVPMLLCGNRAGAGRRYVRYARLYLTRCARHGHPARALQVAASAPGPLRRLAVQTIETLRQWRWGLVGYWSTMRSRKSESPLSERVYV